MAHLDLRSAEGLGIGQPAGERGEEAGSREGQVKEGVGGSREGGGMRPEWMARQAR